jgi:hypothetical protein
MMVAAGRINANAGRLRVEAAGSDGAIDRDFSGPAGLRTDWVQAGDASVAVEKAHKKTSAVEEGGGGTFFGEYRQCSRNYAPYSLKMQMQLIVATPEIMAIAGQKITR